MPQNPAGLDSLSVAPLVLVPAPPHWARVGRQAAGVLLAAGPAAGPLTVAVPEPRVTACPWAAGLVAVGLRVAEPEEAEHR